MNKSKIFIVFVTIIVFAAIVVFFFADRDKVASYSQKFVSNKWEKPYQLLDENPMGLHHFKKLVESKAKGKSLVIKNSLDKNLDSNSTYIFVGNEFGLHTDEFQKLKKEVEDGADLFLSYHLMTDNIYQYFFKETYTRWHYSENIFVHNFDTTFRLSAVYQTDTIAKRWNLITTEILKDSTYTTISYMMESPNFLQLSVGKGNIYLHSTPELFQNYQLLSKNGFAYADFVTSELKPKTKIKWLELGRIDPEAGTDGKDVDKGNEDEHSLLRLIFEQKALTAAFLLILFGLFLYVIFRTKRYWPTIPYLPKNKNRSLDFASTMTAIYFDQQSPYSMLLVMRKNFVASINRHFFIDISKPENEIEIRLLAEKSGVELRELEALNLALKNPKMEVVSYEYIQDVAFKMRQFNFQTGIIKDKLKIKSGQKKVEIKRQIWLAGILIFLGINAFLRGFYLLAKAESMGVVLWPLGVAMVSIGIYLFSRKLLTIDKSQLSWYPYLGKPEVYDLSDILEIRTGNGAESKGTTIILFTGNRELKINHFEISRFSQKDFERFIASFN